MNWFMRCGGFLTIMILMWGETMSDIISRTALLAEYDKHHVGEPGGARKLIEAATTIDAVPVVRCADCIYWSSKRSVCNNLRGLYSQTKETDFCCWGERKAD